MAKSIVALFYAILLTLGITSVGDIQITDVPAKAEDTTRIISFNLRTKDDSYGTVKNRSKFITATLNEYRPDSFGVQECTKKWMSILEEQMPDYAHVGAIRGSGTNDEYSAVFYLKDKYTLLDSGTIWLSETPDKPGSKSYGSTFPRIATWATLQDNDSGKVYTHVNTHLNHIGQNIRYKQAQVLLAKVNELALNNPVVLTGDFNSKAKENAYKSIAEQYNDTRLVAAETENKITFHNYGRNIGNTGVIDFIFASKDVTVERYKVIDNMVNVMYLSDHNGLCSDVKF